MKEDILRQIRAITEKINRCTNAENSIRSVMNSCISKKNEWQESFKVLDADRDLCEVKKTDIFEGEMTLALHAKVAEVRPQLQAGISRSEELGQALSKQCQKLEGTIGSLNQQLNCLYQLAADD